MIDNKKDKINQLARMVAKGFAHIESVMATKEDTANIRAEMTTKKDLANLRNDIDIMLDRHIGTFRKDYDELAARVKRIEETIFK